MRSPYHLNLPTSPASNLHGRHLLSPLSPGSVSHHQAHSILNPHHHNQIWIPRNNSGIDLDMTPPPQLPPSSKDHHHHLSTAASVDTLNMSSINPAFTIRRHIIQIQEEHKQVETLKKTIEARLKIQMPPASSVEEIGVALSDGVVLCHLVNQIFPRAVAIIHVPSLAMVLELYFTFHRKVKSIIEFFFPYKPKLSLAKCRKNVENFIDACRRIGLPEVIIL